MDNSVTPSAVLLRDRQPDHGDTRSPPRPVWEPSLEWLSLLPRANLPSPFLLFPSSFPNQLPLCQLLSHTLFWGGTQSQTQALLPLFCPSKSVPTWPFLFSLLVCSPPLNIHSPPRSTSETDAMSLDRVWVTKSDLLSHTIPWKLWLCTKVGGGQQR